MTIICGNMDYINHQSSGCFGGVYCKLNQIVIDPAGGCMQCEYPEGYWEDYEQKIKKRIEEEKHENQT